ncbi:lipopolysaccharide biosynthesis protein [Geodermatophilus sp. SYSU D01180]
MTPSSDTEIEPTSENSNGGSDLRAGVVVTLGTFAGHLGNYLFYVLAARMLGPAGFAEVSALVAFATLVTQPFTGVQAAAARDIARLRAAGRTTAAAAYLARLGLLAATSTGALLALLLGTSGLLAEWLRLESTGLAMTAGAWIAAWGLAFVGVGAMQGLGRFGQVAWLMGGPLGLLRVVLLVPFVLWLGVTGAMAAMLSAAVIGLVTIALGLAREVRRRRGERASRPKVGSALVALTAFASLTNADVLVAKAGLAPADAGLYASAVLLGKISLFAPMAVAMILLPRAAAALERGEDARRLLVVAQGLTLGLGLLISVVWLVLPPAVVRLTFGEEFDRARHLVLPLSLVMTMAAMLNVAVSYALAAHDRPFPAVLACGALLHVGLLAGIGQSVNAVIAVSATAIGMTLLATELFTGTRVLPTAANMIWLRMTPHPRRPSVDTRGDTSSTRTTD